MFIAHGVGALIGDTLATGQIRAWFGSYIYALYPMTCLAIANIVVAGLLLKRDRALT